MVFLAESILDAAYAAFRTLCSALCEALYPIMSACYKLFMDLATFRLLGTKDMTAIYGKITMILTIVMVFYITFEFVKYAVEPDTMTDKEKGVAKLPQKMIIIVVLIAFIPNIFILLHNIQLTVIKNDVISKIILGRTYASDDYDKVGNQFAWSVLSLFYNTPYTQDDTDKLCGGMQCFYVVEMNKRDMINKGQLKYLNMGINDGEEMVVAFNKTAKVTYIHFDPLWAVAVGVFITWMLVLYCIDMGARIIQMIYLEVIAPIAIIGILSPKKDNIFQKWLKQVITTYLDVFIRLVLINFIILICNKILIQATANAITEGFWVQLAIILGLLVFAKKAPKLLEELFPKMGAAGGSLGLKAGDRNIGRVLGAALGLGTGAVVGAATGFAQGMRKMRSVDPNDKHAGWKKARAFVTGSTWGATRGALGGAGRGLWNGGKKDSNESFGKFIKNSTIGAKKQSQSNKTYGAKAAAGYTIDKQLHDTVGGYFGHSRKEDVERSKEQSETTLKQRESQEKRKSEILDRAKSKAVVDGQYYGSTTLEAAATNYKALEQRKKDLENPNSDVRQQFRIGGEKQDSASQRRIQRLQSQANTLKGRTSRSFSDITGALGISGEDLGIKKMDYYDPTTGNLNQEAYEKAVEGAYKAREDKKIDDQYMALLQRNGLLYSSQDEADHDLAAEQGNIGREFAKAEDKLYAEYAHAARQEKLDAHGNPTGQYNDAVIVQGDERERQAERLHNANADEHHQVNMRAEIQNIVNTTGLTWEEAELEWRKKYVSAQRQEQQLATNEANDKLARINKEMASASGSGGKK